MATINSYFIRIKHRRRSSPPEGMSQFWIEWQVLKDKKIVHRCDTQKQAHEWVKEAAAYCERRQRIRKRLSTLPWLRGQIDA